jgi:hypothetical protein
MSSTDAPLPSMCAATATIWPIVITPGAADPVHEDSVRGAQEPAATGPEAAERRRTLAARGVAPLLSSPAFDGGRSWGRSHSGRSKSLLHVTG